MSKLTLKENFVLKTVFIISVLIEAFRFLRYGVLLLFTPIIAPTYWFFHTKMTGLEVGKDFRVKNWRLPARVLAYGETGAAEAYAEGWVDFSDFEDFCCRFFSSNWCWFLYRFSPYRLERYLMWDLFNLQTKGISASFSKLQYGLEAEKFFETFGGKGAVYSVACYESGAQSLEEAQQAKLKLVAEKLQLQPGMTVLELGCGFGELSKYLASNYGVRVIGVTNSHTMAVGAKQRCEGLSVKILESDWSDVKGVYDRIVCIEMSEHVGWHNYPRFWEKVRSLLRPDGYVVLQTFLARKEACQSEFLAKYMFGQHYVPDMATLNSTAEKHFTLADYQSMNKNAILTLREMGNRLKKHKEELTERFGATKYRAMEACLVGAPGTYVSGAVGHGQFVFYPKELTDRFSDFARLRALRSANAA